ncbi:MAG: hypothetical protein H8D56_03140 [Planctomycetes bacterium]|nr:hypothetical protein [Planctomycetota bacterium]
MNSESTLWRNGSKLRGMIFFLLFYLFLSVYVDLRLLYYVTGATVGISGFPCEWSYLFETLSLPGGLVRYVSVFLTQFFMFRWIGPVVVVLQAWGIALCIDRIVEKCDGKWFGWVRYAPGIVILFFYTSYVYHFETTMAMLVVLGLFNLYITISSQKWQRSLILFVVLMVIAYYIAAAGSLLFLVMCVIYEIAVKKQGIAGVGCLLFGVAVPLLIGVYGFGVSHIGAYSELMPWSWRITKYDLLNRMIPWLYGMYGCMPACLLLMGFLKESERETRSSKRKSKSKKDKNKSRQKVRRTGSDGSGGVMKWVACTAILLGIAGGGAYYFVNDQLKTLYEIEYCRGESEWEKVLELANKQPGQLLSMQARNQALYHLGRFGDEMFNYQQHPDGLMLSHDAFTKSYWHKYHMYIDLGLVGQADEVLTESMVAFGDHPFILKKLALVNMISGKNQTARVYLGALQKRLFFGEWAKEYLVKLEDDPKLIGDNEIQRLRPLIPKEEDWRFLASPEMQLKAQIENVKKNKMAFEYLLALYMLRGEMWNVVEVAGRIEEYDYEKIPVAFEEAILLNNKHNKKKIPLRKLKIRAETKQRFDEFMAATIRYRTKDAARSELTGKFKNTYMYYYFYGIPE